MANYPLNIPIILSYLEQWGNTSKAEHAFKLPFAKGSLKACSAFEVLPYIIRCLETIF